MKQNLEANKQNAIAFYRTAYLGDPVKAVELYAGDEEYVTMDFFRFDENGKIVEHWDSIQQIPGGTKNGNPMY